MDKISLLIADEGKCFANSDETMIFYDSVWITSERDLKFFHQIPLERAKEIVNEYKRKFKIH